MGSALSFDYDAGHNIDEIDDGIESTTATLSYDELDRLEGVTGLGSTYSYDNDEIGNLMEKDEGAVDYDSMTYGSGAGPHAVTSAAESAGDHTFTYDDNGNMLEEEFDDGNSTVTLHEYGYDAEGRVTYRASEGEDTVSYYYDFNGHLERKKASGESKGTYYIGEHYEENLDGDDITKYYFANGARIAMRDPANALYYLTQDHLGGTALVTDEAGNMTARVRYYPYGQTRSVEGTLPTDKLFTGQQQETSNGVYHYKARLYNADIGRMPQADGFVPDPSNVEAYNRYSYVINNPVRYNDPSGLAYISFASPYYRIGGSETCTSPSGCGGGGWSQCGRRAFCRNVSAWVSVFGYAYTTGSDLKYKIAVGLKVCNATVGIGPAPAYGCYTPVSRWHGGARQVWFPYDTGWKQFNSNTYFVYCSGCSGGFGQFTSGGGGTTFNGLGTWTPKGNLYVSVHAAGQSTAWGTFRLGLPAAKTWYFCGMPGMWLPQNVSNWPCLLLPI